MEVVKESRCDIVRAHNFVFILTWSVDVAISISDEQTVWSERCMSDVMSDFVMLISRLVMRDFARH